MFHGLDNRFLYTAFRFEAHFAHKHHGTMLVSGTAFFVRISAELFLVTNRHNVDAYYKDEKYLGYELHKISLAGRFSGDVLTHAVLRPPWDIKFHSDDRNDVVLIKQPDIGADQHTIVIDYFIDESMIAQSNEFTGDLSVCDFVAFPGYPIWHDRVETRPIMRGGTISSDPRKTYHFNDKAGVSCGDCVAYEAFSSGGSSGSPVFVLQKGLKPGTGISFGAFRPAKLIGINGGHMNSPDSSHSGISYFFKSSLIFELSKL